MKFSTNVDAAGHGKVMLNGEDISHCVRGFQVSAHTREATVITLYMAPGSAELEAEGIITAVREVSVQEKILDLDSAEIEKEALDGRQWGTDSTMTEDILAIIVKKLG